MKTEEHKKEIIVRYKEQFFYFFTFDV